MATTHHVSNTQVHYKWNRDLPPAIEIDPGDTVIFDTPEITRNQITKDSTVEAVEKLDFGLIHQIAGPVAIRGAEPGDTLVVNIVEVKPKDWGWTAIIPGFNLLSEDEAFQTPYLKIWDLTKGNIAEFKQGIEIPFEPFCGVMGLAMAEPGEHTTVPPSRVGGNIDIRQLTNGSTLRMPVLVPGVLFSCGDCHAAQGDGEVCGTGIEVEALVTLTFDLIKRQEIPELSFHKPGNMTASWNDKGWECRTAHGPDLWTSTQQATRYMIAYLVKEHGLTQHEAFALCSIAMDLKISEVVDAPNWIVTACLPLGIFLG
jgi:acetamidase/formamidase